MSTYYAKVSYTYPEEFVDYTITFPLHFGEGWPLPDHYKDSGSWKVEECRTFLQSEESSQGLSNPLLGLNCREQVQNPRLLPER